MLIDTAIQILQELALGRNPDTGEPLESDSVLNDVRVASALFLAVQQLGAGFDAPFHKSVDQDLWDEYCALRFYEDPEFPGDEEEEYDDSSLATEYDNGDDGHDFEEPGPDDDDIELIRQEMYEDQENYAKSEEDGWFYPDSEGGWEDNISYEPDDDDIELVHQEMYGDQENYAKSEEDGWFYPDSEGGWEDNIGYESNDYEYKKQRIEGSGS